MELHNVTASGILTRTSAQQLQACTQSSCEEFYTLQTKQNALELSGKTAIPERKQQNATAPLRQCDLLRRMLSISPRTTPADSTHTATADIFMF